MVDDKLVCGDIIISVSWLFGLWIEVSGNVTLHIAGSPEIIISHQWIRCPERRHVEMLYKWPDSPHFKMLIRKDTVDGINLARKPGDMVVLSHYLQSHPKRVCLTWVLVEGLGLFAVWKDMFLRFKTTTLHPNHQFTISWGSPVDGKNAANRLACIKPCK